MTKKLRLFIAVFNRSIDLAPRCLRPAIDRTLRHLLALLRVNATEGLAASRDDNAITIFDISEIDKPYFDFVLPLFHNSDLIAVTHGVTLSEGFERSSKAAMPWMSDSNPGKLVVCAESAGDVENYVKSFGVDEADVMVTGILKHNADWMAAIGARISSETYRRKAWCVLLISRPGGSSYLPHIRKRQYLEEVKQFTEVHGLKLLIKLHPKETREKVFRSVLGQSAEGNTWAFSEQHVFELDENILFAVSFSSGVSLDLLQLNIPTIERLDLRGLEEWDTPDATRNTKGQPIFGYVAKGLVIGATTAVEFRKWAEKLLLDPNTEVTQLHRAYARSFHSPPLHPSKIVAKLMW